MSLASILDYLSSLDSTQFLRLGLQVGIAVATLLILKKFLGGGDAEGHRKFLEQRKRAQTVEVTPGAKGYGGTRRRAENKDRLVTQYDPKIATLAELFNDTVAKFAGNPCLGTRKIVNGVAGDFEWSTYAEVAARRKNLGSGLFLLGQRENEPVGIYSINRPEWVIADLACQAYGFPSVALYDTLGPDAVTYVLNHADIKVTICAGKQLNTIFTSARNCPKLKTIISMDPVTEEQRDNARKIGITLLTLKEVEEKGAQSPQAFPKITPQQIYTIMYTSGTTGNPKGVVLTHENAIAEVTGIRFHDKTSLFGPEDVHMSYLPLAHSFERAVTVCMFSYGARIGYFQGILNELFNDIAALRPTFLVGAPRVWSRLYDKLTLTVNSSSFLRKKLFYMGFEAKKKAFQRGEQAPLWDKLVFSKTKARLGGRVKFILSGSAPLDPGLGEFLRICFCCPVIEGYGLTENFAGAFITELEESQLAHVGKPLCCVEARLADVPEMEHFSTNNPPTGEICLRGANIFREYYKEEDKTIECKEPDGWFHTGDIGRWNPNGTLSIIDRKKNIFKLSQGEYVAPEYLENVFIKNSFVSQIWVYGNSFKRFLIAVVVPDPDTLLPWAKQNGLEGDYKALCGNPKVNKMILDSLEKHAKESKLHGFEYIKAIFLSSSPFSVDNDLMTPTFKLRRPQLLKYYQKEVDAMYLQIGD